MAEPWLVIIGLGEDGLSGLSEASRLALSHAEYIFGGPRHLALVDAGERGRAWPVPFDLAPLLALRGQSVVVLASGDPFWFGAGGSLSDHLDPSEWRTHSGASSFGLAASRLGWRLETVTCLGLHAQPHARALPALTQGARVICLMREGIAVADFARWLVSEGFGPSTLWVMEALGGPRERIRKTRAEDYDQTGIIMPVAIALIIAGGKGLPRSPGLPDAVFSHDGQITKAPMRALALSALAPRPGERLWDIGAGSGSVSIEWCLAGGEALALELRPDRAGRIRDNALKFGVDDRLSVIEGRALTQLSGRPVPDAVFVGGGADQALFAALWSMLPPGCRFVANAVTLETEALLLHWHRDKGGALMRIEIAQSTPLGEMRGWQPSRPVVQWSVTT
ncbi:MAG: precorrin-6y C5,15-methyltransferase (decarboxylating) subunit CbiE [Beijerinckiaceae bacterium]